MDMWDYADAANDKKWIDDRLHEEQLRKEAEMTERIDHVDEAIGYREAAAAVPTSDAALLLAAGQIHATLALVEQQRIANLIALENQRWVRHCQVGAYFGPDILRGNPTTELGSAELKPEIAEALGIGQGKNDD